jgi:hypothetical protein
MNLTIILFSIILIIGCNNKTDKTEFPKDTDFKLSYTLSNQTPKLGEQIEINALLGNLSNNNVILEADPMINIDFFKPGETEDVIRVGVGMTHDIKAQSSYKESKKVLFDKIGKYKINITSNFIISGDPHNPSIIFNYKTEPTIIDIK